MVNVSDLASSNFSGLRMMAMISERSTSSTTSTCWMSQDLGFWIFLVMSTLD